MSRLRAPHATGFGSASASARGILPRTPWPLGCRPDPSGWQEGEGVKIAFAFPLFEKITRFEEEPKATGGALAVREGCGRSVGGVPSTRCEASSTARMGH